jgi:hypothetical protein
MNFLDRFSKKKKAQISSFIKIRPVGADVVHSDGHDEANNRFSQPGERA